MVASQDATMHLSHSAVTVHCSTPLAEHSTATTRGQGGSHHSCGRTPCTIAKADQSDASPCKSQKDHLHGTTLLPGRCQASPQATQPALRHRCRTPAALLLPSGRLPLAQTRQPSGPHASAAPQLQPANQTMHHFLVVVHEGYDLQDGASC